jgi:hypothetical protein
MTHGVDQEEEASEETPAQREVYIVMMPVKDMGPARKMLVRVLRYSLGSLAAAGWCMHWAILAEHSCFELQRYPTRPYTRLRASHWDGSRSAEVIQRMKIGSTAWQDADIERLGQIAYNINYFTSRLIFT